MITSSYVIIFYSHNNIIVPTPPRPPHSDMLIYFYLFIILFYFFLIVFRLFFCYRDRSRSYCKRWTTTIIRVSCARVDSKLYDAIRRFDSRNYVDARAFKRQRINGTYYYNFEVYLNVSRKSIDSTLMSRFFLVYKSIIFGLN